MLFLGAVLLFAVALLVTAPSLWRAAEKLIGDLPRFRDQLATTLASHPHLASLSGSIRRFQVGQLAQGVDLGAALALSTSMAEVVGYGITALFLTVYLLADRERMQGALYAVVPRAHRAGVDRPRGHRGRLHPRAGHHLGADRRLHPGAADGAACARPRGLAAFAGLTDVIPFVGGILATAPAALAGLSRGTGVTVAIVVLLVAYQEFESRLLIPRIYGRTLKLPSAGVLVALLVGGRLGGIFGALIALPIAATIVSVVKELRVELPGELAVDPAQREADARAERAYARRAQGASAAEAAQTALEVAQRTHPADERH